MIAAAEIAAGLYGALMLLRRDPKGLGWFDATRRGFVHSFFAALMVAPAFFILEFFEGTFSTPAGPVRGVLIEAVGFVMFWTAFPLAMAFVAEGLGKGHNWVRFVVAYNWSGAVQMAIYFPVGLLAALLPGPAASLASLAVTAFLLVYQGYVAHKALEVGPGTAAGVVVLDVLLGILIRLVMSRMLMA